MRNWNLITLIGLLWLTTSAVGQGTPIRTVTSLPGTCNGGTAGVQSEQVVLVSGGVGVLYICNQPNTWVTVGNSAPGGSSAAAQFNNGGTFGGAKYEGYTEGTTAAGQIRATNVNGKRYVTTDYQYSVAPAGTLTGASPATVTVPTCWLGVDTSGNTNHPYFVYISTQGTPEAAQVTGGTCTPGLTNGTIQFTPANNHSAGFTVSSATAGIQEAINDVGNPDETVQIPDCGGQSTPCYQIYSDIFLNKNKITLWGYGAWLQCNTRDVCLFMGDYSASPGFDSARVMGLRFKPGLNVDGVQIQTVQAAAGTYTITTAANHPYVTGDQVCERYWSTNNAQSGCFKVLSTPALNQFTYATGSATFGSSAAFGFSDIKAAAIEDSHEGAVMRDLLISSGNGTAFFNAGIIIDNDQKALLDTFSNEGSGNAFRNTANWVAPAVWGRGDQGYAPVLYATHLELSLGCKGNGIYYAGGNTAHITDSVIQGFSQFGLDMENGIQSSEIDNVYQESTTCTNPVFGIPAQEGIRASGQTTVIHSNAPFSAIPPNFNGTTPANQINYFIVPHSSISGVGPVIPIGYAQPLNGAVAIPVQWFCVSPNGAGTVTYDLLATTGGAVQTPITGTANFAVATALASSCSTSGIMSFSDTQAARNSYTVSALHAWAPIIPFSPVAFVVDNNGRLLVDLWQSDGTLTTGNENQPSVTAAQCDNGFNANIGVVGPQFIQCNAVGSSAAFQFGNLMISTDNTGTAIASGHKGKLNFWKTPTTAPGHIITLVDSNPQKTSNTLFNRPSNDAADAFIGEDQANGISYGANVSHSWYIGNVGDNTNWISRLTTALQSFKVPELDIGPQDTVSNGILGLKGKTSGTATITAPAVAGTALNPMIFSNAISLLAQGSPTNPTIAMAGGGSINSVSNAVEIDQGGNPSQSLGGNVKNASSLGYCWTNTTNATTGTSDTCSWRSAAGVFAFGNATASNTSGQLKAAAYMSVGTTFTSNAGCTESALTGGATAGKFTVGQNTACTIIITMGNSASAPNGWSCYANDQTNVPAVAIRQTASNNTTASLLMTVATSDVISFGCLGY